MFVSGNNRREVFNNTINVINAYVQGEELSAPCTMTDTFDTMAGKVISDLESMIVQMDQANTHKRELARVKRAKDKQERRDNAIAYLALWMKENDKHKGDLFTNEEYRGGEGSASRTAATLRLLEEAGVIKRREGFSPLVFEIL